MAIRNVISLFNAIDERDDLRRRLNRCSNKSELFKCLDMYHLAFSADEFEEAINVMHTQCQTREDADALFGKVHWLRFLFYSLATE